MEKTQIETKSHINLLTPKTLGTVEKKRPLLSIVIPAFNEKENIREILHRLLTIRNHLIDTKTVSDVEIIVVDDCSTDQTGNEVVRFDSGYIQLIVHPENRGYGAALKTGFKTATGEWIAFLDADLTYPPESFPSLCEGMRQNDADIIVGSRMMNQRGGMPIPRYIGNKIFAYLLSWIMDKRITDIASGMRVFKRSILSLLTLLPNGLHMTPAMSTRALLENLKVVEIGIPYHERAGQSKLNAFIDGIRFLKIILGTAQLYRPLKFFGSVGAFLIFLGIGLGLPPLLHYLHIQRVEDYMIYRLFTVMVSLVLGLNILTFGAFSERVLQITYHRPRYGGFWERWIFRKGVVDQFGSIGFLSIFLGVVLNYKTIFQYLTTFQVTIHWSYILTGATFLLCGFQMVMASFLIKILKTIATQNMSLQNSRFGD